MISILLLHRDPRFRSLLQALPARYRLQEVSGWEALHDALRTVGAGGVALVDPSWGGAADEGLACLRRVREAFPSTVVVATVREAVQYSELREMAQVGVAEVIRLEVDCTPYRVGRLIERACERSALRGVLVALPASVPPRTRTLMEAALATTVAGGSVAELARTLFISVRTLQRRCARSGLPPSRTLLALLRMVLSARYLDDPGRTVLSAALAAGYSSDTSLHRAFRRVGLPTPARLRRGPALEAAVASFLVRTGMGPAEGPD